MMNALSASAPSRLRRLITSALVTLGIAAGMVAVTPTPAHAASFVMGCFVPARVTNPAHDLTGFPIQVHAYYNGSTYLVAIVRLDADHCARYEVPAHLRGFHLTMMLDYRFGDAFYQQHWLGLSPWWAEPGDGYSPLGINAAYCRTGCFVY